MRASVDWAFHIHLAVDPRRPSPKFLNKKCFEWKLISCIYEFYEKSRKETSQRSRVEDNCHSSKVTMSVPYSVGGTTANIGEAKFAHFGGISFDEITCISTCN